jgi:hypothetical protein
LDEKYAVLQKEIVSLKQKIVLLFFLILGAFCYAQNITKEVFPSNNLSDHIVSETFTAADFPVKILELSDANPVPKPDPITNITNYIHSGQYSGKGYIIVPYLADTKIAVIFNNITVNTNYQLINGIVETSYNPDAPNISDLEDVTGGNNGETVTQTVPFEIVSVTINPNGDIIVSGPNGEQITIPGGSNTVITGSNGQIYNVDSQGNVTGPFTPAPGGATTPQNTDGVSASGLTTVFTAQGITVTFEPTTTTKYSWDVVPDTAPSYIKDKYAKVGSAYLPYKAVVNGQSDVLEAKIYITDTKINKKDLFIKTNMGKLITFDSISNLLTLRGSLSYAEEEVQAVIKQGDKYKVAGAFKLVHISEKPVTITLVPLNNTNSIPTTAITNLETVFAKAGVKLTVKTAPVLTYDGGGDNKITTSDSDIFDYYTDEEKAINAQLKALPNYDPKTYYLIYSNLQSDKGIEGFMALGGQFGYVFPNASNKTAPHELAHGVFALQHPFSTDGDKGKTPFLMDYGTGTELWHNDWAQINNPALKYYGFQSSGDGEQISLDLKHLEKYANKNNTGEIVSFTFIAPSGLYVTLDKSVKKVSFSTLDRLVNSGTNNQVDDLFPLGCLISFVDKNNVSFSARYSNSIFKGYLKKDTEEYYIDNLTKNINPDSGISLFIGVEDKKIVSYYSRFSSSVQQIYPSSEYKAYGNALTSFSVLEITDIETEWKVFLTQKAKNNELSSLNSNLIDFYLTNYIGLYSLFPNEIGLEETKPVEFLQKKLNINSKIKEYIYYFEIVNMKRSDFQSFANCLKSNSINFENKVRDDFKPIGMYDDSVSKKLKAYTKFSSSLRGQITDFLIEQTTATTDAFTNLITSITSNPNITSQEVYNGLVSDYKVCAFPSINITSRLKIIDKILKLDDEFWSFNDKNILYDLVSTTPFEDQAKLIKDGFLLNNYGWLKRIKELAPESITDLSNDLDFEDVVPLYDLIGHFTINNWDKLKANIVRTRYKETIVNNLFDVTETEFYPSEIPYIISIDGQTFNIDNYKFNLYFANWNYNDTATNNLRLQNEYHIIDNHPQVYQQGVTPVEKKEIIDYNYNFNFLEPITVIFNTDKFNNYGYQKGQTYEITALQAYTFKIILDKEQTALNIRQATNVLAIVAAPFTGGSSLGAFATTVATTTAAASAVDLFITEAVRDNQIDTNSEVYKAWNSFHTAVSFADGAIGLEVIFSRALQSSIAKRFYKFSQEFNASPLNFKNAINNKWTLFKSTVSGAGNVFKVGDNVAGKIIQKVLTGSNGKVAIVGRKMAGHVEDAAATLRAEGKQVEIFSELDQKNNLFNINGTNKSWQDIVDDFGNKSGQYLTNDKGWILDSELPKTMMYKANKIWADKLKALGYTVIDIGYPSGASLPQSVFYNMEISTLFP